MFDFFSLLQVEYKSLIQFMVLCVYCVDSFGQLQYVYPYKEFDSGLEKKYQKMSKENTGT